MILALLLGLAAHAASFQFSCTGRIWAHEPWDRVRGEAPLEQLDGPVAFITIDREFRSAAFRAPGVSFAGAIFDEHDSGTPQAWLTGTTGRPDGITGQLLYYGATPLGELRAGEAAAFGASTETYVEMGDHGEDGYHPGHYYDLLCQPVSIPTGQQTP